MDIGHALRVCARPLALVLALVAAPDRAGAATEVPGAVESVGQAAAARLVEPAEPFGLAGAVPAAAADAARWREALEAVAADRAVLARCRGEPEGCPPAARQFLDIVESARGKQGRARLGAVNRAVNLALAYTSDLAQHGVADVWSAPLASFASGRGDCEDYAIAKYLALLELGVPAADLRLVVVEARRPGRHAVLAARLDGRWLVLDNARMPMVEDRDLAIYRAVAALGSGEDGAPAATRLAAAAPEPPSP